jgi:general secretion pathway protein G
MAFRTISGSGRRHGFTLIELLVVMVIIASLLAIAVPRYLHSLDHSREVVLLQDLAVLRDAIDQYYEDRGHYPESLMVLSDERYIRKVPVDPITKSADSWVIVGRESGDIAGVYDVHSGAEGLSSNGVPFSEL